MASNLLFHAIAIEILNLKKPHQVKVLGNGSMFANKFLSNVVEQVTTVGSNSLFSS